MRIFGLGRAAAGAGLVAAAIVSAPAMASGQERDQAPVRTLQVQLPPSDEQARRLAERERQLRMLRAIEAHQAEGAPLRATAPQPAQRDNEPLRFDMATFRRLAEQIGQRPGEEPQAEKEEPQYDRYGRPLARIDWDSMATDWRRQMDQDEADAVADSRIVTHVPPPRPHTPRITNREMGELERPRLPVLLPRETEAVHTRSLTREGGEDGMMFYPHDDFYAATYHKRGMMVQITGTRIEAAYERDPEIGRRFLAMSDADGYFLTRTDFGVEINFTRYGAAYSVLVACDNPDDDPECRDEHALRGVISHLAISGGTPQGLPDSDRPLRRLP